MEYQLETQKIQDDALYIELRKQISSLTEELAISKFAYRKIAELEKRLEEQKEEIEIKWNRFEQVRVNNVTQISMQADLIARLKMEKEYYKAKAEGLLG